MPSVSHRVKYTTVPIRDEEEASPSLQHTHLIPMEIVPSHTQPLSPRASSSFITRIRTLDRRKKWIIGILLACILFALWVWARITGRLPLVNGAVMVMYARHGYPWDKAQPGQGTASGMSRWAGMFSEVTSVFGALHFAETHGAVGVKVVMDSENLIDSPGDNWWEYYFSNPMMIQKNVINPPEVHLNGWIAKYGRFGGFGHLIYGDTYDIQALYPIRIGMHRHHVNRLIKSYIRIHDDIARYTENFWKEHMSLVEYTVAIHYRGLDSKFHYPYYNIPYEKMLSILDHVLSANAANRSYRVFVATDETEFIQYMKNTTHADKLVYSDSPRAHRGGNALHFTDTGVSRRERGESAVRDMLLMSYASYLIKTRSSISDTSVVFNPNMPYTYVIGNDEIYHSKDYETKP